MHEKEYDIIIIGAGPAGLMAAIECFSPGQHILVLEKMQSPALKLKISGKGRCNITNDAEMDDFISHFGKNGRFLKFAFAEFFNKDLLSYFEKLGVRFKLERGGRYFPVNDNAMEIVNALLDKVKSLDIPVSVRSEVTGIKKDHDNKFIISVNRCGRPQKLKTDKVLITTGGKSYPGTGSDGAGYKMAAELGHTITPLSPSLVPIETKGGTAKKLQGLSLKNVKASVWCNNKKITEEFGEMLFTHFGLSGPIILSLSKCVKKLLDEKQTPVISIDLKPALEHATIEKRLLTEISAHGRQNIRTLLKTLLPGKMVAVFIEQLKLPESKKLNTINSEERKRLRMLLKDFRLEAKACLSFNTAIVTSGGVSIKEINQQTMESKLVKGLYFAGEVIDIDADTGGFNLQAAFSTGRIAGISMKH